MRVRSCVALLIFITSFALVQSAVGATVRAGVSDECKVEITGPIEEGDLAAFQRAATRAFPQEVGESTAANTVCLNSPGGSFVEGVKLARLFYETGVGTVVPENAECYSACAIMFMMGRADGAEVSFINRKLHVRGQLGFHRPNLSLPGGGSYDAEEMAMSYDLAVSSVVDFMALANKISPWSTVPMVRSDLIERMFATKADEIYEITTVEQAARWDIQLVGVKQPTQIDEAHAYYACENTLQYKTGLYELLPNFSILTIRGMSTTAPAFGKHDKNGNLVFDVTSQKAGYGAAGCLVSYADGNLRVCAVDDYTGTAIGSQTCFDEGLEGMAWGDPLTIWHPTTTIAETASGSLAGESVLGECRVSKASTTIDLEPCSATISIEYPADATPVTVVSFAWPSGSKTRIASFGGGRVTLNGASGEQEYGQGFDACYSNFESGNLFCFAIK